MGDSIRISAAVNGYVVECRDPEIDKKNREPDSSWQDPYRQIVCKDTAEVATVLDAVLPTLVMQSEKEEAEDTFESAFTQAVKGISK